MLRIMKNHKQKNWIRPLFYTSEMDSNIRNETIKPLEENIGKMFIIGLGNHFLDMTPKTQAAKAKLINQTT